MPSVSGLLMELRSHIGVRSGDHQWADPQIRCGVFVMETMNSQFDLLGRLIQASEMRQRVISNNLANVNTPNYRRRLLAARCNCFHLRLGRCPCIHGIQHHGRLTTLTIWLTKKTSLQNCFCRLIRSSASPPELHRERGFGLSSVRQSFWLFAFSSRADFAVTCVRLGR